MYSDACTRNLMMDQSRILPKGSHFLATHTHDGVRPITSWHRRCSVSPIKYFYIDFGLSWWYPNGHKSAGVIGFTGQIKSAPELSDTVPYNPFKLDIYQLGFSFLQVIKVGDLFYQRIYLCIYTLFWGQKYPDLDIFRSFAEHMINDDPHSRPTANEALLEFETMVLSITQQKLHARIWRKEDSRSIRYFRFPQKLK